MNLWNQYKAMFVTALIAIALGFGTGYYVKSRFVQADKADALSQELKDTREVRREDARNVADAQTESEAISDRQERTDATIEEIKKEIRKHAPMEVASRPQRQSHIAVRQPMPLGTDTLDQGHVAKEGQQEPDSVADDPSARGFLTVGELRLLNRAYESARTLGDPARKGNGAATTATQIARATSGSEGLGNVRSDPGPVHRPSPDDRRHVSEDGTGL